MHACMRSYVHACIYMFLYLMWRAGQIHCQLNSVSLLGHLLMLAEARWAPLDTGGDSQSVCCCCQVQLRFCCLFDVDMDQSYVVGVSLQLLHHLSSVCKVDQGVSGVCESCYRHTVTLILSVEVSMT